MAQTPALLFHEGRYIDHTPVGAVIAGDVILIGTVPMIAPVDIPAAILGALDSEGVYKVPKVTGAILIGAAIYWDADGSPVTGTASSGAATGTATGNNLMGFAVAAAASGDTYVIVKLTGGTLGGLVVSGQMPRIPTATVAAAGSIQGDAGALIEGFNLVTGADDTKGVRLPLAVAGMQVIVKVGDGADLKVWPGVGDAINAIAANTAMTVVDDVCFLLTALDATTWYSLPLLPS